MRGFHRLIVILAGALSLVCCDGRAEQSGEAAQQKTAAASTQDSGRGETALFAGGCFWSIERMMEQTPGVVSAVSGFAGGSVSNPTYDQVVAGRTGHLEVVQVTFDPSRITYRQLVDRFWRMIDPMDAGGQFCDRGANYGTAVFATATQRPAADASRAAAVSVIGGDGFRTVVRDNARFWPAAAEHQDFWRRNLTRYEGYSRFCGRERRLRQIWGNR